MDASWHVLEKCPDISVSTVEVTLAALLREGYIIKTGTGRNTAYIRNTDYPNTNTE
jgi:predicted transcriptional regulator